MACCAFVVFILGQIYLAAEALAARFGFAPRAQGAPLATDWHWGAAVATVAAKPDRFLLAPIGTRVALAGTLSMIALVVGVFASRADSRQIDLAIYLADPAHRCGSLISAGSL